MAKKAGIPATPRFSPQVICSAFVEQYYHALHEIPDQMHRFYQEISTIGRAGSDGVMEYVTTLAEINKKVMSVDYSKYVTEIVSADPVLSDDSGILIVVTGSLTTSGGVYQRFTQTFLLSPQQSGGYFVLGDILIVMPETSGGYFVLRDIFRMMPETSPISINQVVNQESTSNQESGTSHDDGSVAESRVESEIGDWEVLNHTVDGATAETNVSAQQPVPVTEEDPKEAPDAASSAPPPQARNDATNRSYVSAVTSLFSLLLDVM